MTNINDPTMTTYFPTKHHLAPTAPVAGTLSWSVTGLPGEDRIGMGCVIEGNSGNRCPSLADLHLVLGSAGGQAGAKIYLPPNCQGQLELYILY